MMSKVNLTTKNILNLWFIEFLTVVDFAHHTGCIIEGLYNKNFLIG